MTDLKSRAPAIEKAFAILAFVGQRREASFTDIYSTLGLAKSSTHYILDTLVRLGMLRCVENNRFVLGLNLFELGTLAVRNRTIRQEALPLMRELSETVGLICHLGILEGTEAVYLVKVESHRHPLRVDSWEGKRISLHSSALGKVLLAWKDESEISRILSAIPMTASTATTITDPSVYRKHLDEVRNQGWAVDSGEDIPEISCYAVPIRDRNGIVTYALSVTGTTSQIRAEPAEFFLVPLMHCAERIAQTMGATTGQLHN